MAFAGNIFNVLFILGFSALIVPLVVSRQLIRLDVPLMIAVSFLLILLSLDGEISRLEGAFLFAGIIVYTVFLIRQSRRESAALAVELPEGYTDRSSSSWLANVAMVIIGLALLVLIARWEGALFLAFYVAYVVYLILNATQHATVPLFEAAMTYFVLPLTAITLLVIGVRSRKQAIR